VNKIFLAQTIYLCANNRTVVSNELEKEVKVSGRCTLEVTFPEFTRIYVLTAVLLMMKVF
jgi:hypothetical protein